MNTATRANNAPTPTKRSRITSTLSDFVMASHPWPSPNCLPGRPTPIEYRLVDRETCGSGAPMAFSEELAERIRQGLARRKGIEEKKMFGGIGLLLNGNLLVGVWKDSLIVRLGPEEGDEALKEAHGQRVQHHGPGDEGLGAGRPGRRRGRRRVERLGSAGGEVCREAASEIRGEKANERHGTVSCQQTRRGSDHRRRWRRLPLPGHRRGHQRQVRLV